MAITLKNPASDLASALTGTSVGGVTLTTGTNLFATQHWPVPADLHVQLLNTGGPPADPYISPTASAYFRAQVQVLIYGTPGEDGFTAGETLARGVLGALQQARPSGYVSVTFGESQPTYVGPDPESMRHVWSLNATAAYVA
jgi:hypothetical protein